MNSFTQILSLVFLFLCLPLFGSACTSTISSPRIQTKVIPSAAPASSATAEISITPSSPDTEESNEPLKTEYSPATAAIMPCSPIKGYELNGLSALINNPFTPPPPGRDDPHQGVDFAITQYNIAVAGHPVQSIFSGTIVAVLSDRFPYGNAVLVETPLEDIAFPQDLLYYSATPAAGWTPHPSLTCPIITPEPQWDRPVKSLYHLYAHLEKAPEFKSGAPVGCGDRIGMVGGSGNALNPHLHLETRIGPAGARFASMAHYDSRASVEEMYNYCTWRVRGIFQLVDPTKILGIKSP